MASNGIHRNFRSLIGRSVDLLKSTLIIALLPLCLVSAQVDEVESEEVFTLSPFEVTADDGYTATHMLQGGRGRVDLDDVAVPIEVFTLELMEDLAVSTAEEAFLFSTNTSTYYEMGDYNNNQLNGGTERPDGTITSRGLGAINRTRNFFETNFAFDTYNMERLTLVSGANAVMFGLGAPAGTSDSQTARALTNKDRGKFQARFDDYGSQRFVLDYNKVLLEDKLALRFAGVKDDKEYFLRPGFDDQERKYLSVTFKVSEKTTLRATREWIDREISRAPTIMPRDEGWLEWYEGYLAGDPIEYANTASGPQPPLPQRTLGNNTVANYLRKSATSTKLYTFGFVPDNRIGVFDYNRTVTPRVTPRAFSKSLLVPEFIPWNTHMAGTNRVNIQKGAITSFFLEQEFTDNTYLEIAFNRETFDQRQSGITSNDYDISVDVNKYLPDGVTPNPTYGQPFIEDVIGGSGNFFVLEQEEIRATLAHQLDFTKNDGWLRHLGDHKFAAFASENSSVSKQASGIRNFIIGDDVSFLQAIHNPNNRGRVVLGNPGSNFRELNYRYYLPPIGLPNDPMLSDPEDLAISTHPAVAGDPFGITTYTFETGETFQTSIWANPVGLLTGGGNYDFEMKQSHAYSSTSSFLDNRLVVNMGYRHDTVKGSRVARRDVRSLAELVQTEERVIPRYRPLWEDDPQAVNRQLNATRPISPDIREWYFEPEYGEGLSDNRFNYGFVLRPFPGGLREVITLGYSYSENAPQATALSTRDVFGEFVESPSGESDDFSVRLSLLQNRLNVRASYFKASIADSFGPNHFPTMRALYVFENDIAILDPSLVPQLNEFFLEPGGNGDQFRVPMDKTTSGLSFNVVFNPNENWRFTFSAGKNETDWDKAKAQGFFDYIDNLASSVLPGVTGPDADGNTVTGWQNVVFENQSVQDAYLELVDAPRQIFEEKIGPLGDNAQTWRANLVAKYQFREGKLNGTGIGATARYRGPSMIGFGEQIIDGTAVPDFSIEHKSDSTYKFGLFANHRFKIWDQNVTAQLNIDNMFNSDRVVLTRAYADGSPRLYARQPGREYKLTLTTNF